MRILSIDPEPIAQVPYLNAGRGPGDFFEDRLPILNALVDRLPEGLSALVATSDLQFRETFEESRGGPPRLLGEVLPQKLRRDILPLLDLPPGQVGVLLAGDFYTVPALDRRGGTGDVTAVWQAFADHFDWVAGVAGNHDLFGTSTHPPNRLKNSTSISYLDGNLACRNGLRLAGLGGIVGNSRKPHRRSEEDFLHALESLLQPSPDVLLLHDGPCGEGNQRGLPLVRELLERYPPSLIIRGHAHWSRPLAVLANGSQVLNADARLLVLRTA